MNQSIFVIMALIVIGLGFVIATPVGFSYAKFSGPVIGPEKAIYVKDEHGHQHIDYIATPNYSFSYGVDDPKSKVLQNRKEIRHGDAVKGEYSVVDPDGTLRVVKYTADKANGFQAEVITDGKSEVHGHDAHHHQQNHKNNPHNYYNHVEDVPPLSYGTNAHHPDQHKHYAGTGIEDVEDDGGSVSSESSEDNEYY